MIFNKLITLYTNFVLFCFFFVLFCFFFQPIVLQSQVHLETCSLFLLVCDSQMLSSNYPRLMI